MIADDDPHIVELLEETLSYAGYEVSSVTHSLRVFDRAKESRPDLILMDVMMPYLDGFDQLRVLALDEELRGNPIVLNTAKRNALEGIADPRVLGIVDCVFKPFEIANLLQRVEAALVSKAE